jgi:uncharacterized protein YqkB
MKYLMILSFLSVCYTAESQCCPYINNIEVIPAAPATIDHVKIVTTVTTPNQGAFLNSTHSISGNTINIEACYYNGLLTATQTFYDTLDVGLLNSGIFTVNLTAYESTDTVCNYTDSSTSVVNFTVIEQTNQVDPISYDIGEIYPNPTSGSFTIELPKEIKATHVCIRTISGRLVYQGAFTNEMSVDFNAGMYLIQLLQDNTILWYHRLLIF